MKLNDNITSVTAFAPATCANVAVGYDLLGFSLNCVGDTIQLIRHENELMIAAIHSENELPYDINKNVATYVIKKLCQDYNLPMNFKIEIKKGIALGSGMGGSAASAVAALTALNGFLQQPMDLTTLATYAIYGEELVSGSKHADNVVPCVYGGLTLTRCLSPLEVLHLPIIDLYCILVHPNLRVDTKDARAVLPKEMPLTNYIQQSANLASFIIGIYEKNYDLISSSLEDVLIEPYRAKLVKGFNKVKAAALESNALGMSLSGSGPSVFAFAKNKIDAEQIKHQMITAFAAEKIESTGWVSQINKERAKILEIH